MGTSRAVSTLTSGLTLAACGVIHLNDSRDEGYGMSAADRRRPYIVGIGGTTRPNSSTEKALRFALGVCSDGGADTYGFYGVELSELPMYAPENPTRTQTAERFITELRRADGIIVASPGYHGS